MTDSFGDKVPDVVVPHNDNVQDIEGVDAGADNGAGSSDTNGGGVSFADRSVAERYTRSMQQEVLEAEPITIDSLLAAGAHFGHQSYRWDPRMLPYLFGENNGIHIINLDLTLEAWKKAEKFLEDVANKGGSILFVGTKPQAREIVQEAAEKCGGFSVTQRWLGGTLSNFETIKRSISRMRKIEELLERLAQPDNNIKLNKKERLGMARELEKLSANLGGIRTMRHVPDVVFVVDVKKEHIAIKEARRLHIPVVALTDSNVDPTVVDFPIPCNDDATKAIKLFVENVAAAISRGRSAFLSRAPEPKSSEGRERRGRHGGGKSGGKGDKQPASGEATLEVSSKGRGSRNKNEPVSKDGSNSEEDKKSGSDAAVAI